MLKKCISSSNPSKNYETYESGTSFRSWRLTFITLSYFAINKNKEVIAKKHPKFNKKIKFTARLKRTAIWRLKGTGLGQLHANIQVDLNHKIFHWISGKFRKRTELSEGTNWPPIRWLFPDKREQPVEGRSEQAHNSKLSRQYTGEWEESVYAGGEI